MQDSGCAEFKAGISVIGVVGYGVWTTGAAPFGEASASG